METPSRLTSDISREIDKLLRQVTVAHELDDGIQAELRTHMEDKVEGYLKGEEKISPADALLLTQKHFGDAGVIKSLMQNVHARPYHLSLARRLLAAGFITLVVPLLLWPVFLLYRYLLGMANPFFQSEIFYYLLPILITNGILWGIFVWIRRSAPNLPLGLQSWSITRIVLVFALLFLMIFTRKYYFINFLYSAYPGGLSDMDIFFLPKIVLAVVQFSLVMYLWLWWCDQSPRRWYPLFITALAYLVFALFGLFGEIITQPILFYYINNTDPQVIKGVPSLAFYYGFIRLLTFLLPGALLALMAYIGHTRVWIGIKVGNWTIAHH